LENETIKQMYCNRKKNDLRNTNIEVNRIKNYKHTEITNDSNLYNPEKDTNVYCLNNV
jgi:hypothetical protein